MRSAAAVALLVLALASPAAAVVSITTCGTEIPAGETGVLANSLDCTNVTGVCIECGENGCAPGSQVCTSQADCSGPDQTGCRFQPAVTIHKRGTLDMNGFFIDGGPNCTAVNCRDMRGKCAITSSTGRGTIKGSHGCVVLAHKTKLTISNIDTYRCGEGIVSNDISASIDATDVTVRESVGNGIRAATVRATNVTSWFNGGRGISAEAGKLTGTNVQVISNGGVGAVSSKAFKLTGFVATSNGFLTSEGDGAGLWALRGGKMSSSALSANVYHDASGEIPMDILSGGRLKFTDVTCERSGGNGGLLNGWGVCAGD